MVRSRSISWSSPTSFPPRPWGWSVGVFAGTRKVNLLSFPHARGDGPVRSFYIDSLRRFSPRPWGWSATRAVSRDLARVFPTPVGMVRHRTDRLAQRHRFPHARGDGPIKKNEYLTLQ